MEQVEVIIKIPKFYAQFLTHPKDYNCLAESVRKGVILPKGHKIIDANKVQEKINKLLKEPDYQHEGEDWRAGLIMAQELIADTLDAESKLEDI